jgi:hypothetical protein
MQKKLSYEGGKYDRKKCKRGYGGGRWSLRLAGVWSQAVIFCWCIWQESGLSRRENVFTQTKIINHVLSVRFAKIMQK